MTTVSGPFKQRSHHVTDIMGMRYEYAPLDFNLTKLIRLSSKLRIHINNKKKFQINCSYVYSFKWLSLVTVSLGLMPINHNIQNMITDWTITSIDTYTSIYIYIYIYTYTHMNNIETIWHLLQDIISIH